MQTGKHYGRQHARTAELYRQRREARERAAQGQQGMTDEVHAEPLGAEAPPMEEPILQHADAEPDEATRERLRTRAQQAVTSVLRAARQAARKAGSAVSGVRRVAREVSARKGPTVPQE